MPTIAQEAWAAAQKARRAQRERFTRARNAEIQYGAQIRRIADQIGLLASAFNPEDPASAAGIEQMLKEYSRIIAPWARNTANRMLADVAKRDEKMWFEQSAEIGRNLREEIAEAPTGQIMQRLLDEQVTLITSLPLEAAQRVHELALRGITEGSRGGDIYQMIMASGEVAKSRATLIARTETARTASVLTQARAEWIGSDGYIWRNVGDADVRPHIGIKGFARLNTLKLGSHRKLEGTFQRWDSPPIASENGKRMHPGCIYNCRCYAEVVIPRERAA
jgi:uncharacterized protein with gpF-like domain